MIHSSDGSRKEELDEFHSVLEDISMGRSTERVRAFIVNAFVRGISVGCAENCELEGQRVRGKRGGGSSE